MSVEQDIYSNFYDSIASKFTKSGYANTLKHFMIFSKIDKYSDLLSLPNIFDSIKSYILYLKDKGLSSRTITTKLFALKCFYEMNNIEDIRWKKLKRFRGEDNINEDRGYTHEEIQQILNVADLRTKAVILLLASSGIRMGALSYLKVGSIENHKISVYEKSPQKYITFMTPEAKSAIDNYLQFRERCGEHITNESPLFRSEFNINLPNVGVKPLGREGHHRHLYLVLIKSGLRQINKGTYIRRNVMMIHGFRKFFKTQPF